ncbi:glycoside hydrolase [Sphingomonas sp. Leaf339]|uniref:glycoside hydrolase family 16 protein n=1 Tax=Sphingomonas sp. Leaf339 TaxID=1736343 RepID=UPI0006F8BAED|nr:glycoside hydrolase family 16 protein [Sphingomonas sp. Leaf339]KQU55790.1 glycoside hydrolase [Sphingomonas sp. Leaf339]
MILLALAAQAATIGATNYQVDVPMAVPTRRATFADEFTGGTVDTRVWRFDTSRNAAGWYNNERQYYANGRRRNARIERGALVIEAWREAVRKPRFADAGGQDYTSAKLVSRQALGYGFYEIRAKLPCGRGSWPAIWMLPTGGTWPDQGEIDIMEMVGWNPEVVHATVHSGAFNHVKGTQRGAETRVGASCTAFHHYQLDWGPTTIRIGIDGRAFMAVANDQPSGAAAWPFTRPYQLILNLAVGGDWGGKQGIDDAAFPQRMTVDYVRYWARTR